MRGVVTNVTATLAACKKREMERVSIDRSALNLIVQKAAATANARTVRRQTDRRVSVTPYLNRCRSCFFLCGFNYYAVGYYGSTWGLPSLSPRKITSRSRGEKENGRFSFPRQFFGWWARIQPRPPLFRVKEDRTPEALKQKT